jgi:hypothetical protein
VLFDINLVDLGLNLRLELIGGALEFIESSPYLTANLWELFGTTKIRRAKKNRKIISEKPRFMDSSYCGCGIWAKPMAKLCFPHLLGTETLWPLGAS